VPFGFAEQCNAVDAFGPEPVRFSDAAAGLGATDCCRSAASEILSSLGGFVSATLPRYIKHTSLEQYVMALTFTQTYADQLDAAIHHAIQAHTYFPNTPRDAIRLWDKQTPYVIHPIWCAMTLLSETELSDDIRFPGAIALLWHDILEDTQLPLPDDAQPIIQQLVHEMTFTSLDEELEGLWERSATTKLLKLYDKASQFLDSKWMKQVRLKQLVDHTRRLEQFVLATYGELNIVKISRAVCQLR
jgi:hypothetical protein